MKCTSLIALFLLTFLTVGLLSGPAAAETAKNARVADPQYIVFQLGHDKRDFETLLPEIKAEFGTQSPGRSRYIGFGVALMTLKTPPEELRSQVVHALDLAGQTGMPVLIKLDDMNFTAELTDPSMVEWTGFPKPGETHGPVAKHYWLNWGSWMALPPIPNFESPAFRHDVETRLKDGVLPPLVERLAKWKKTNRSHLFAGIVLGWETGIPEYRPLRNAVLLPRDEQRKITMTEDERGEQLGYAALYTRGWTQQKIEQRAKETGKTPEDVITELLFRVIHDYSAFWTKTVHDAGIPRERIYTHGVAWESVPPNKLPGAWMANSSRVPPIWVNVNRDSRPGYTAGAGQFDTFGMTRLLRGAGATGGWGAVEAYVRGAESEGAFGQYLRDLFGTGVRMIDIFGWTATSSPYDPKKAPGALRTIHTWLEGKELPKAAAEAQPGPAANAPAIPESLQQKMQRLQAQIQQLQQQGVDLQPVGEIMQGLPPLVEQQKFTDAEALVDWALKKAAELAPTPQPPAPSQPPSSPPQPPQSLQQKMHRLEALVQELQQKGVDLQPVGDIMQGFQPLMEQQKYTEAEALLDRALKQAGELAPPGAKPAAAAPPPQQTMLRQNKPTPDDPDYVVYQFMDDPQHPDRAEPWVKRLLAEFGPQKPRQSKYIGFGFFIQDMNDDPASLRQRIETLLGFAEKYEIPVFSHLDGVMFWDRRTDGLPANPEAVEWSAFPAAGEKTGPAFRRTWFDWGEVTSLAAPPPCFESALFRADVKERLEKSVAAPIRAALARWRSGSVDRSYLFAGMTVGNEIGVPDYRTFKMRFERNPNAPRPRDRKTGTEMTDAEMARGGFCSLYHRGYTSQKIEKVTKQRFGAAATQADTDAVITELLDNIVHDYMAFRAKILRDSLASIGSAQMRIYTHTTSTFRKRFLQSMPIMAQGIPSIGAAVNQYSRPGFTVVRNVVDLPDVVSQMRAARGADASSEIPWGAVESYATVGQPGPPQSHEEYSAYLDLLFGSGAKLVSLLEAPQSANNPFTIAAESPGVKSAVREWATR